MKVLSAAATILTIGIALGQVPSGPAPSGPAEDSGTQDTANRAVARISIINGVVSVRRGDSGEAVAAALNAPMTATDRLFTGEGSRAEIQFDALNMIRVAPSTDVRLGELAYHHYQVQIAVGTTEFRVLRDNDAEIEISTPSIAVRPLKHGIYRITVRQDGSSEVTVREGEAEIASPKGTEKLGHGKTMEARDTAGDPEFQVVGAIAADQWDQWNAERDHDLEKSVSGRYVNPDVNGTEDLDQNGRWVNDPAYGQVWVPAVDPGWAPYRVGRWVWVDYYGWAWVSADPWGWAPYHYGRWYLSAYGWAWWPGMISGPCYWQPALVGFFGWGPGVGFGVGFGFGFGNVGWVPLAPYERFYPGYGAGVYGRGFGAVNIAHNANVANLYRNARANGVTSMASNQFGRGSVSAANYVHATSADLARAGSVRGSMPITPSRESTHFSSNAAGAASSHASENSHFYSTHAASASSSHISFDQQRQAMARSASSMAASRVATSPAASSGSSAASSTPTRSGSSTGTGWQRASPSSASTTPSSSAAHSTTAATGSSTGGGWQRFNGNNSGVSQGSATANGNSSSSGEGRASESRSSAVRINPSVVQKSGSSSSSTSSSSGRGSSSAPRSSGGSSRGSSSGGGRR